MNAKATLSKDSIHRVAKAWLLSAWLEQEILLRTGFPGRFTELEAEHFGEYMAEAAVFAPTHAFPKFPYNLILELGLDHGALVPGAKTKTLERRFPAEAVERIDAMRKLGPSVMFEAMELASRLVLIHGKVEVLIHNAAHFGFAGLYLNRLANQGFIATLRNTAGRGNEVFPYGGNYADPECARMGTDPYAFAFPTKEKLGFNVMGDFALSSISFGGLKRKAALGQSLRPGMAVDDAGDVVTEAEKAKRLLFETHKEFALAVEMEGLAGLMGGGWPPKRAMAQGKEPGGSADWILSVAAPEYYSCADGDPVDRMVEILSGIVKDNGNARLPGSSYLGKSDTIELTELEFASFKRMAEEAEVSLD